MKNIFISIIYILFLTFCSFLTSSYAQEDIIRVKTDLVTVPVTVLNRNGQYITNLKKEEFKIFEDGIEQEIALFESVGQKLTIFLLLDRSGSMSRNMSELAYAANTFIKQLSSDDELIVATFADEVNMLFKATKVSDLSKGINLRQRRGDQYTRLYDAVNYALKKVKKVVGRKAIVVFSDGMGDGVFSSSNDNLRDAEESEALIYTIQFDTLSNTAPQFVNKKTYYERINQGNVYMQKLAKVSGGQHYQVEDISNLSETFAQVANELGQQYSIGYYPKESGEKGERRNIKVKVNIPNVAVRARESYVVGSGKK